MAVKLISFPDAQTRSLTCLTSPGAAATVATGGDTSLIFLGISGLKVKTNLSRTTIFPKKVLHCFVSRSVGRIFFSCVNRGKNSINTLETLHPVDLLLLTGAAETAQCIKHFSHFNLSDVKAYLSPNLT